MGDRPVDRGSQVVLLMIEVPHARLAGRRQDVGAEALGQLSHHAGMALLESRPLAALIQPLKGVLPEELMEAEPGLLLVVRLQVQQRMKYQNGYGEAAAN